MMRATKGSGWFSSKKGAAVAAIAVAGVVFAGGLATAQAATLKVAPIKTAKVAKTTQAEIFVSPSGSDSAAGTPTAPLKTIQAALNKAQAGTTVHLGAGVYHETPKTVRAGTKSAPITIAGPETGKDKSGRYKAVLFGKGRIFNIDHSYIHVQGFTIDGQEALRNTTMPTDYTRATAFKKSVQSKVKDGRLIYVGSSDKSKNITGVQIDNMFLSGAGGECVRIRNNAHDNSVTNSVIQFCGMFAKGDDKKRAAFHNGEGVYIGTSPKSTNQPMHAKDASANNRIANNTIATFGSECFEVKENAHNNIFENNKCSGNTETAEFKGSNVELRGYNNIVRNNVITGSLNWNVKIQSDSDKFQNGGNVVQGNVLSGAKNKAIYAKNPAKQGSLTNNTTGKAS